MRTFNLSANIENGFAEGTQYIVTPNAQKAIHNIVKDFRSGIHSFTIIGSYGTGKSSFLLALESDLLNKSNKKYLLDKSNLSDTVNNFEFLNIVGDYAELSKLLSQKLNVYGSSILDELKTYYNNCQLKKKFLVIVIDEFGKILEHAAKNNPEKELYFMQKLAEFVNVPSRNILLLTTLHQNFSSYAKGLLFFYIISTSLTSTLYFASSSKPSPLSFIYPSTIALLMSDLYLTASSTKG